MNKKRGMFAATMICVLAVIAVFTLQGRNQNHDIAKEAEKNCTLKIDCQSISDENQKFKDGIIYLNENAVFYEGDTAIEVMKRELEKNEIHYETDNSFGDENAYVKGIANIYEKDYGELSGWLYYVNGEMPNCGAGQYEIKENDVIEWKYSRNFDEDF